MSTIPTTHKGATRFDSFRQRSPYAKTYRSTTYAMFPVADASAKGMIVYQTDNAFGFWYYDGITWRQLLGSDKGWSITGNAGTVDGTNF
ncbi:MAG: hypothetical protein IPJ66_11810 [Bacteroidetes bacterium]|nr:hypothetical protein [Bacteroidota bacterium]